jgi:uncharacterized protein (DUF2267 family)
MIMSGFDVFDRATNKANQWLDELIGELGWTERYDAYIALRAVLQTLRDFLPLEEVVDFGAQLPMVIRGFYYEGWTGGPSPGTPGDPTGYLEKVSDQLSEAFLPTGGEAATRAVFRILARRVSEGEIYHIGHRLPASVRRLWPKDSGTHRPIRGSQPR